MERPVLNRTNQAPAIAVNTGEALWAYGIVRESDHGLLTAYNRDEFEDEEAALAAAARGLVAWQDALPKDRVSLRRIVIKTVGWAYA